MIFKVNDKDYNLKMTTKGCVNCEARLGKNPINIFMEASDNRMPKISDLMVILHESLQPFNHGMKMEDVFKLYDEYCEGDGDLVSLIETLVGVFEEAGFLPKDSDEKN